jgi:transcriptional regulator with PAS, ATPase and Fis domain
LPFLQHAQELRLHLERHLADLVQQQGASARLLEQADQGTLFMDEVADLSPTAQAKLLRVLQDMTVERIGGHAPTKIDTRVVVATNRSLHDMVAAGRFRADLYYRLSGVEIVVPPLRTRREDIPLLVRHFLSIYSPTITMTVAPNAAEAMVAYDWPGNVRQLGRVLERAVALASRPEIALADLPDQLRNAGRKVLGTEPQSDDSLRAWSSRYVHLVLARCGGNKRRACEVLDISYHTLQAHLTFNQMLAPRVPDSPDRHALSVRCDAIV